MIDRELWIPIRYYNFKYALSESNFDIEKALEYAKKELFDLNGDPVFLPRQLSVKRMNSKGKEETIHYMSYTKLMKAVDEKEREFINNTSNLNSY